MNENHWYPSMHAEGRMRVADGAEAQAIVRDNKIAQLCAGLLEGGERRRGIHLASGKDAVTGGDPSAAIEKEIVQRVDDGARLRLRTERARQSRLGPAWRRATA